MDAGRQQNIVSSLPIFAIFAIIAGAYYASRLPLESARPESPAGLGHIVPEKHKIDARLWQDPLKVVMDHEKAAHSGQTGQAGEEKVTCSSEHCVNQITQQISDLLDAAEVRRSKNPHIPPADPNHPTVQVLLTIVRDGTFEEDHERRLRNRYAMLSALHLSGFVAKDSAHIQYFRVSWPDTDHAWKDAQSVRGLDGTSPDMLKSLIVPYEWFQRETLYPRVDGKETLRQNDERDKHVVVVWLPEGAFSHRPLTRLALIIDALGHKSDQSVKFDVIGPSYSGTLRVMIDEIKDVLGLRAQPAKPRVGDNSTIDANIECRDWNVVDVSSMLNGLTIFSAWSTVSPPLLVRDWPIQNPKNDSLSKLYEVIPDMFQKIGMKFVRTIGSDDLLAMQLINELRRRHVDLNGGKQRVALICEWDTLYGKVFPMTFATMLESMKCDDNQPRNWVEYAKKLHNKMAVDQPCFPEKLCMYSYIRGVDGKLPGAPAAEKDGKKPEEEVESKWVYNKELELPIGPSQLDYVRRLAQKMDDDHDVTRKVMKKETLAAIGLVGSDVYDKLIMLHALREQFGDVILFMTDLDARIAHAEQFQWTRNVIVASNFGLRLDDKYQVAAYRQGKGAAPPFRDGYMTSLFFACRMALGLRLHGSPTSFRDMDQRQLTEVLRHPRLFEIGRGHAIDLSVENADIHPLRIVSPPWRLLLLCVLVILTIVLLLFVVSQNVRQILRRVERRARAVKMMMNTKTLKPWTWNPYNTVMTLSIGAVAAFVALALSDHYRLTGEPFSIVTGVSIWPGSAMRLSVVILSIVFATTLSTGLREAENSLGKDFKLQSDQLDSSQNSHGRGSKRSSIHGVKGIYSNVRTYWSLIKRYRTMKSEVRLSKTANARTLWRLYRRRHRLRIHLVEMILFISLFAVLLYLLLQLFDRPNTPARGSLSFTVDGVLAMLCVFSMLVLLFFVVDSTWSCLNLTRPLIDRPTVWPRRKRAELENDSVLTPDDFEGLLDVRFVTRLTESIGKLIYYPFIILVIMIAARARYFDNWNFPYSLIVVYAVPLTYLISCMIGLQRTAKRSRQKALGDLREKLFMARFGQNENYCRALKINRMIEEIESIREGAFRPFLQNPVIHVLLGSGGVGLLGVLRLFLSS